MTSTLLRFLAESPAVGPQGRVPAGLVAKWVDEAATTVAGEWSTSACQATHLGCLRLQRPVLAGDMVEVEARLAVTGETSMNIYVEVRSGNPRDGELPLVTHTVVVCVALDHSGQVCPVDHWNPETPGDMALAQRVRGQLQAMQAMQAAAQEA